MSLISKPVDWELFSIPPIQSVQYYSILKKRREFSQLMKQYEAQVLKQGYLHYCGIIPKYLSSPFSNRCEIFIVFFSESSTTSFIGFRVKANKETFKYETKSLLMFLKNSGKAIFYSMNSNCIHVHCGTNAWELFYLLYDNYLRRYVLTIIGTQFFYHFIYSYCIEKEKLLLKFLFKGSRVIRISKASIYYKIHRKRKVSVTDLIHMTVNMPKRKKYTLSYFSSKEPLLHSDIENGDFYTVDGNKINVSKLLLKKYKKEGIIHEKCNRKLVSTDIKHKRKFDENDAESETHTSSKHFKTSESDSTESHWSQYQKFKPFSVQNYSSLSFINTLVPSLLKSEKLSHNSNSHSEKLHSNRNVPTLGNFDSKSSSLERKLMSKDISSYHSTFPDKNHEKLSDTINSDLTKSCDINSVNFLTNVKATSDESFSSEDINFTTATGKVLNISTAAMLKAYKLCEKEHKLPDRITKNVKQKTPEKKASNFVKHYVSENINYPTSTRKSVTKDSNLPKISERNRLSLKSNENMPKKFRITRSSNTETMKLLNFDVTEDVTFSTAAGKTINVSNAALKAAQKLIYKSNDEEKMSVYGTGIHGMRNQIYKKEICNNGSTSKADDLDMDNTLVEKFFEDVQFDEKDLRLIEGHKPKDSLNLNLDSKNENLPTHKPRKSLGGRRSMRYCPDKL